MSNTEVFDVLSTFGAIMITTEVLHCERGDLHAEINDTDPEERKKLAASIVQLLTQGALIVIKDGAGKDVRVIGYNAETNEWVTSEAKKTRGRRPAAGSKATVVAPLAGG